MAGGAGTGQTELLLAIMKACVERKLLVLVASRTNTVVYSISAGFVALMEKFSLPVPAAYRLFSTSLRGGPGCMHRKRPGYAAMSYKKFIGDVSVIPILFTTMDLIMLGEVNDQLFAMTVLDRAATFPTGIVFQSSDKQI